MDFGSSNKKSHITVTEYVVIWLLVVWTFTDHTFEVLKQALL